jgi:pentatricopeptide repeat protein
MPGEAGIHENTELIGETAGEDEQDLPTGYLREGSPSVTSSLQETEAAHAEPPKSVEAASEPVFRARVARGPWAESAELANAAAAQPSPAAAGGDVQAVETQAAATAPEAAPPAPPQESTAATAQPSTSVLQTTPLSATPPQSPWEQIAASVTAEDSTAPAGPKVEFEDTPPRVAARGDITTSGPLPSLDGFEDLHEWIQMNPHDTGAHIALASAYTQAGDVESALRLYRRMLRKPNVSETVMRMIEDELIDMAPEADHIARFHQVRGDLYLRQGRHREAIEEFNKLVI